MLNLNEVQISVLLEHSHIHSFMLSVAAFIQWWQNSVVVTDCMVLSTFQPIVGCTTNHSDTVITWQHFMCHVYCCIATILFNITSVHSLCKNKKRKLDFECYTFKAQWIMDYFIIKTQSIVLIMQCHYKCTKRIHIYIDYHAKYSSWYSQCTEKQC